MKKLAIVGVITTGFVLLAIAGSNNTQSSSFNPTQTHATKSTADTKVTTQAANTPKKLTDKVKPVCDGKAITASCVLGKTNYKTYIYHPAVAEKTHVEAITTYQEEVTGYCTLCNDGTYSPTCATGRGACSHHGGVEQWNAPKRSKVPVTQSKTVVDIPAQKAYYEKVLE